MIAAVVVGVFVGIGLYIFFAYCWYRLFKKAGVNHAWMAWVPVLSAWPYMWTIGKSAWWLLMTLVPIANVVFGIIWQKQLLNCFGKSGHWLWFYFLPYAGPVVIVVLQCYITLSSQVQYRGVPKVIYNAGTSL